MPRQREVKTAGPLVPDLAGLGELRRAAASCTACELHKLGTNTVFGRGAPDAEVMVVGEQPGDQEDRAGKPFVGPAGHVLDRGMSEAGIDRSRAYVLRAPGDEARRQAMDDFVAHLRVVARLLDSG